MDNIQAIALLLGAGWASGINLYAAVLVLGWLGSNGQVQLPEGLVFLTHPGILIAAGGMYTLEFFADKIPGIDSLWDIVHSFIRIPGGALLAAGAASGLDAGAGVEFMGLLLGGSLAATSHVAKAGTRAVINTSPEPLSNWTASISEDVAVVGGLWTALNYPIVFIILLILFIALVIWLLPKIWGLLKTLFAKIKRPFSKQKEEIS